MDTIKDLFVEPSVDSWNNQIIKNKEEENSEDEEKIEYLEMVRKDLSIYKENSKVVLLSLQIDTFLTSLSLQKNTQRKENLEKFCQLVAKKLKTLGVKIGKDNGLLEDILSLVGNNSQRYPEYRIIQFQIIFILLACSTIKLKDLRTLNLEQIKSLLVSPQDLSPKGVELLKEKMKLIEIFYQKYSSLGCCLKKKYPSLMSYTTFSSIINDELKRVLLVLVELKKYKVEMDLITPMNLKNSLVEST